MLLVSGVREGVRRSHGSLMHRKDRVKVVFSILVELGPCTLWIDIVQNLFIAILRKHSQQCCMLLWRSLSKAHSCWHLVLTGDSAVRGSYNGLVIPLDRRCNNFDCCIRGP